MKKSAKAVVPVFCAMMGFIVHAGGYTWTQGEMETNKVDLLFVFDRSATEWLADSRFTNANAFVQSSVSGLNSALAFTDLDRLFTFRVAGVETVDHSFSGGDPQDLVKRICRARKVSGSEGSAFARIRARRNESHADVVVVLSDGFGSKVFGSSNPLLEKGLSPANLEQFKERAYCFCDISSDGSRHTILHELGHVMGAGHSDDEWEHGMCGPQLFDFSSAFHFSVGTNRYATVMANTVNVFDGTRWTRHPFFSSSSHTMRITDARTGKTVDTGVTIGSATHDNTRTLRETYRYVANFRVSKRMAEVPVDPDAIRLSVVTGGVPMAANGVVDARCYLSHDIRIDANAAVEPQVKVTGLPPGLRYSSKTGRIWGWPTKPGKYAVKVKANNRAGYRAALSFRVHVKTFGGRAVDRRGPVGLGVIAKRRRPWRRPDGPYYALPKPLSVTLTADSPGDTGLGAGDHLEVTLSGHDGVGRVSGSISGVRVDSFLNFVRFGAGGGAGESQERAGCLLAFPPQAGTSFAGYVRWVDFLVTVDGEWHINDMQLASVQKM